MNPKCGLRVECVGNRHDNSLYGSYFEVHTVLHIKFIYTITYILTHITEYRVCWYGPQSNRSINSLVQLFYFMRVIAKVHNNKYKGPHLKK